VTAVVALVAFFAIYGLAVQTEVGQHADDAALTGSRSAPQRAQTGANGLLRLISFASIAAALIGLGVLAWLRRRPWLIALPVVIVGASLLAAEVFKLVILQRPDLWPSAVLTGNTYPSGHTTIAVGLGLSALLVAPERARGLVAVGAALLAGGVGVLVVTADWHRPSDPLGSYALTLAVAAIAVAALEAWEPRYLDPDREVDGRRPSTTILARRVEAAGIAAGIVLFVGAVAFAALRYGPNVDWNRPHAVFLGSVVAILVAAGVSVGALLRALPEPASYGARHGP
jgi:membrane-associated phospholipid phosphatase